MRIVEAGKLITCNNAKTFGMSAVVLNNDSIIRTAHGFGEDFLKFVKKNRDSKILGFIVGELVECGNSYTVYFTENVGGWPTQFKSFCCGQNMYPEHLTEYKPNIEVKEI